MNSRQTSTIVTAMNAIELLCRLNERELDSLFRVARTLPADRLDWKPAPGARSALDQLQEVVTAPIEFWSLYTDGKTSWNDESFAKWKETRSKLTTLDQLEKVGKENTAKLNEFMRTVDPAKLEDIVELPFPGGPYTVADVLSYHYWNISYHEGQITYIASLLEEGK